VVHDEDQYSTDLMKCIQALEAKEEAEGGEVSIAWLERA
jgi:thiamine pyrophosphokinase